MSTSLTRRGFMLAAGAVLTTRKGTPFAVEDQTIAIHPETEIGVIRPELHGQFAEHLGSCVYGGLWLGDRYRQQAVDYLKPLEIPVLRWPGGCFADDYHWHDAVGPAAKRKKIVNVHWGGYIEDNSFGTHEFVGLCRAIGAQPYLAGNVGSGTPEELRDWMEYCNYPKGSSLAEERAANGSPEPFNVKYWGVGNENWGCGGNMTPAEYCTQYRRFATYLRGFGDTKPYLIACGPNKNDANWTETFLQNMRRTVPSGFSMHFYSNSKSFATKFTVEDMQAQFATFPLLEKAAADQRALIDKYDPQKRIGLILDEWGVWDRMVPEEEKSHGRLWQQITMRSAVAGALGLNAFHRQADKLVMCNIAQMVNVLHSLLLTDNDRCVRTSTYWVYDMMKRQRSQMAVKVDQPEPGVSVSASTKGKELVLTCVNPKHDVTVRLNCPLSGAKAAGGKGRVLHDGDLNAANTFDQPDRIMPKECAVEASGSNVRIELPPLSVVTAVVQLS